MIRYETGKVLKNCFSINKDKLFKWLLIHDSNYNFRINDFTTFSPERYNFNDLINNSFERYQNREKAALTLIDSELITFALSWKDYSDFFEIKYDVNLNCFMLYQRQLDLLIYVCEKFSDPFSELKYNEYVSLRDYMDKHGIMQKIIPYINGILESDEDALHVEIIFQNSQNLFPKARIQNSRKPLLIYVDY